MLKKQYAGQFDVGHHVTFVRYWMPTCFPSTGIPYVIGPAGGGEMTPLQFERRFSFRPWVYEKLRRFVRSFVPVDPFVRASVSKASCVLSTTKESAEKMSRLKAPRIELYPESGLSREEFDRLGTLPLNPGSNPMVFASSGRLLALKGFDLGLRAFAESGLTDAKFWVIGDGPERQRLETLVQELEIADRVSFKGWVQREEGMSILSSAHVLVHPSLHDSGGWVCPEAMGMGKAVICLDLGGPGAQISPETGISIKALGYDETVRGISDAMRRLAEDRALLRRMGEAGRKEVSERYIWENRCQYYSSIYYQIVRSK
jgi:glycosyltransferase involved in cell wall biosynthesis